MFKDIDYIRIISILTISARIEKEFNDKFMCEPRTWNKLYTEPVIEDSHSSSVILFAERNDYELFKVTIKLDGNDNLGTISDKIKRGFEQLESYRTCDCSEKAGICVKHITKLEVKLPDSAGQTARINFGRR